MTEFAEAPEALTKTSSAEQVWKENIQTIRFYHGTSEEIADQIKENGLSPELKPYDQSDIDFLVKIAEKLGSSAAYIDKKGEKVYITDSLIDACDYAMGGPEVLRLFVLEKCDVILGAQRQEEEGLGHIQAEVLARAADIRERTIGALKFYKPALVEITRDSESLAVVLSRKLEDRAGCLTDKEKFVQEVQRIMKTTGLSEKLAAKTLSDEILYRLREVVSNIPIPPQDLTIKKEEDFYQLTRYTRKIKQMIDEYLFDVDEQPWEVIAAIEDFVDYDSGDEASIVRICEYYGIDQVSIGKIIERISLKKGD